MGLLYLSLPQLKQPSGEFLTNYVALLCVEVAQPSAVEEILTAQCILKDVSCEQLYTYVHGIPAVFTKIGSTEKYALA